MSVELPRARLGSCLPRVLSRLVAPTNKRRNPHTHCVWSAGFALCLTLLCAATPVYADMVLSNAIVHFEEGSAARQDVEISNVGDEPLYVQIEPHIVLNPGTDEEQRVLIKNPREHGLLVTPSRMVLAPGTAKSMRMVKLAMPDDPKQEKERIYRISARPVVGEVTAEQTGLKVLIGYEVLAIVYPKSPTPDLVVKREGLSLTAHNAGNTNVLLQEGFQCETPEQPLEDCAPVRGKRMYPGLTWSVELERDLPVRFFQSVGTRNYVETYN